jgi:hypothetical protein
MSQTVRELANLIAAALILGQAVAEQPPSWWLILTGIAAWTAFVWYGMRLEGE